MKSYERETTELLSSSEKVQDLFADFIYAIDSKNNIRGIRYVNQREMYISTDGGVIHIRERTPEKLYTRAIFEVLHNI